MFLAKDRSASLVSLYGSARAKACFCASDLGILDSVIKDGKVGGWLSEIGATTPKRDTVLLSHANPEDNEFTLWLALQLANEGYKVWCDLTKLLGGEIFWDDIEEVIRNTAVKVLYVLSRTSNAKDGPLRELQVAQGVARREKLKDFVIPLHIDDLPHNEITIELTRVIAIPFENSWAAGLVSLLEKIETQRIPKSASFNRSAVNEWWRTKFSAAQGVRDEEEECLSNLFPIIAFPEHVYFHSLGRHGIGKLEATEDLPYPAFQDGISLITFAKAEDFEGKLGPGIYIAEASEPFLVKELLEDHERDFGKHLFRLLRLAGEQLLRGRDLPVHQLANERKAFYFVKDKVPADKVVFTGVDGAKAHRSMVGYSTKTNPTTGEKKKRYWHFAIEARPQVHPSLGYFMKPHVVFSNDAKTIWTSKKGLAAARRSECKDWWNDTWRDRTIGVVFYLAEGSDCIRVPLGSDVSLTVATWPVVFKSPVAYTDPQLIDTELTVDDYGRSPEEGEDPFEDKQE